MCMMSIFGIYALRWLILAGGRMCPEPADVWLDLDDCCRWSESMLEYRVGVGERVFEF
jgi:hypothetical protein